MGFFTSTFKNNYCQNLEPLNPEDVARKSEGSEQLLNAMSAILARYRGEDAEDNQLVKFRDSHQLTPPDQEIDEHWQQFLVKENETMRSLLRSQAVQTSPKGGAFPASIRKQANNRILGSSHHSNPTTGSEETKTFAPGGLQTPQS